MISYLSNKYIFTAILAFTYVCLYGSILSHYIFNVNKQYIDLMLNIILSFEYAFIFFLILQINKYLFGIVTIITFISTNIAAYFLYFYEIKISNRTLGLIFDTPLNISLEFIDIYLILSIIFSFLIAIFFVVNYFKFQTENLKDLLQRNKFIKLRAVQKSSS